MTTEVEQRIVEMRFDNEQFERGAKQSLATLEKLDGVLDMLASGGGLERLGYALEEMQYRFSSLGIAGAAAIERVTGKVLNLATNILSAIPQQIMSGGEQRALNIEQAKFQLKGLGVAWEDLSASIDYAVMGTAYGVDEAAKIASILAASGVDFKNAADGATDMGQALRAISGIAGMTNSSFEEIGNLMGDIFAMGKLSTRQLQSFELRGLNVAAKLAEMSQNGTLKKVGNDVKYTEEQIRELVSKGKIDALTFAKAMDVAFGEHATKANETYTGALRNMKAALSRIGEPFFAAWHEGLRKIFLSARRTFDKVKGILKPFAEGKFASTIDHLSTRVDELLTNIETLGLPVLQKIIDKISNSSIWTKGIDKIIDAFVKLNRVVYWLVAAEDSAENINGKFSWLITVRDNLKTIVPLLTKVKDTIKTIFDSGLFKVIGTNILYKLSFVIKSITQFLDPIITKLKNNAPKIASFLIIVDAQLGTTILAMESIFDSLVRLGTAIFKLIFTIISKITEKIDKNSLFHGYRNGLWEVTDATTAVIDKITEFINKLTEMIATGKRVEGPFGTLVTIFGAIAKGIGGAISSIRDFVRYIFGLQEGETVFTKFAGIAKDAGKTIGDTFGDIRDAIKETFSEDGIGQSAIQAAGAFYTILIGYRKLESAKWGLDRFGRVLTFLKEGIVDIYEKIKTVNLLEIANKVETVLSRTSGALRAFSDNLNAKSLLYIAGAVIALAFGLMLLSSFDEKGLAKAITALAAVMGTLIGALFLLKKVTDQGLLKDIEKGFKGFGTVLKNAFNKYMTAVIIKEYAKALLIFSAAILVLVVAVAALAYAIDKLGFGKIALAIISIAALAGILIGAIWALNKITENIKVVDTTKFVVIGVALAIFAAGILILAAAMALMGAAVAKFGPENMLYAVLDLVAVLAAMAVILAVLSSEKISSVKMLAAAIAIVILAAAIDLLVIGLIALGIAVDKIGGSKLWNAIGMIAALAVILGALTVALSFFASPLVILASVALIALAVAIDILVIGLIALGIAVDKIGGGKLWNAIGMIAALSVIFVSLITIIGILSPLLMAAANVFKAFAEGAKIVSEAFINVGAAMLSLAIALNMMPDGDIIKSIGSGLGKFAWGLAELGVAGWLFEKGTNEGVFDPLISLATAMSILSSVNFTKLTDKEHGLKALAKQLKEFGGMFGTGSYLMWGDTGLAGAGPAFALLGEGLKKLTPGMLEFEKIQNPAGIIESLKDLGIALSRMADLTTGNNANFTLIADALKTIATSVNTISSNKIEDIRLLGTVLSETFTKSTGKAAASLAADVDELLQVLVNKSQAFVTTGESIPVYIWTGINNKRAKPVNEFLAIFTAMVNFVNSGTYMTNWNTIGYNIAIGIANGITRGTSTAIGAMNRLAGSIQRSFTVSLAIRSPSRIMEGLAEYIPAGIAQGIQNGEGEVVSAMGSMIFPLLTMIDEAAKEAGKADFTPNITPVMDMANMKRDIGYADKMLQNSRVANMGQISGLNVSGDSISYNMQNKDVVNAVRQLETRIGQLGEAMAKMQIVLDSGILVGQLANPMNYQLGMIATREGRQ